MFVYRIWAVFNSTPKMESVVAEQIIHWDAVPELGLPAWDATPATTNALWDIALACQGFRAICTMAEPASRCMRRRMQPDCADLDSIEPDLRLYVCLVKCYEGALESSGRAYGILEQEKNLPAVALSSFASLRQYQAERVLDVLLTVGSQLNAALYHHVRLKLADAVDADAAVSGPKPEDALRQATEEALQLIGVARILKKPGPFDPRDERDNPSRALEKRLRNYRQSEEGGLDTLALFETYATAPEAIAHLQQELQDEVRRAEAPELSGGLSAVVAQLQGVKSRMTSASVIADLLVLPLSQGEALRNRARHLVRAAYNAEAPQRSTTSLDAPFGEADDAHSLLDFIRHRDALDPDEYLIQQEDAREREQAEDALRKQVLRLPAKQSKVLLEYWQGLRAGYRLSGKRGNSFRQLWGTEDYLRKQVMLSRLRQTRPDLVADVEKAAAGLALSDTSD